jgi:hypothetical protein
MKTQKQCQKQNSIGGSFRALMAAVINRSLADLERGGLATAASPAVKDEAMAWINGRDCEEYCLTLDMDYTALREKAAGLYRRFLERAEGCGKARGRPRKRIVLPVSAQRSGA